MKIGKNKSKEKRKKLAMTYLQKFSISPHLFSSLFLDSFLNIFVVFFFKRDKKELWLCEW